MQVYKSLISDVGGKRLDSLSPPITPTCVLGGARVLKVTTVEMSLSFRACEE